MTQKRWRLVVTELGAQGAPLAETTVEAGDWMSALSRARAAIGERGGVPPGASCAVAPDGRVTVLDGVARRQYQLAPTTSLPPPAAQPAPVAPAAPEAPKKKLNRTMAYMPAASSAPVAQPASAPVAAPVAPAPFATPVASPEPVAARPPSQPPDRPRSAPPPPAIGLGSASSTATGAPSPARAKVPKHTVAYMAPAGAAPSSPGSQPAMPAAPMPAAAIPAAAAPSAPPAPVAAPIAPPVAAPSAPAEPRKKVSKQTVAYMAPVVAQPTPPVEIAAPVAMPSAPPPSSAPASMPSAPPSAAPSVAPAAFAPAAFAPAAFAPAAIAHEAPRRPSSAPSRPPPPEPFHLLLSRDAEPTKESPLAYRERNWRLDGGAEIDDAELFLRRQFAQLRDELAGRPKGKLVKLAVFDHAWEGTPQRPPLVALQWKDWRGEPEILFPLGQAAQPASLPPPAAPSAPPVAAPPVAAPVAEPVAPSVAPAAPMVQPVAPPPPPPPPPEPPVVAAPPPPPPPPPPSAPPPSPFSPAAIIAPAAAVPLVTPLPPAPASAPPPPAPVIATAPALDSTAAPISRSRTTSSPGLADDKLAHAFEALQDLFFLQSSLEGVEFVVQLLAELVPSEAATAALYDINSDELRIVMCTGPGAEQHKGEAVPASAGLLGAAAQDFARVTLIEEVTSDFRFDPGVDGRVGLEPRTMAILPVVHQGRFLAVLQLTNRMNQAQFGRSDSSVLAYVGEKLGEFLFQAKLAAGEKPRPVRGTRPSR